MYINIRRGDMTGAFIGMIGASIYMTGAFIGMTGAFTGMHDRRLYRHNRRLHIHDRRLHLCDYRLPTSRNMRLQTSYFSSKLAGTGLVHLVDVETCHVYICSFNDNLNNILPLLSNASIIWLCVRHPMSICSHMSSLSHINNCPKWFI